MFGTTTPFLGTVYVTETDGQMGSHTTTTCVRFERFFLESCFACPRKIMRFTVFIDSGTVVKADTLKKWKVLTLYCDLCLRQKIFLFHELVLDKCSGI
jgi:hypothetical protein